MALENNAPRLEILQEKKLIGKYLQMSFGDDKTQALWRSFMPYRHEIRNKVNTDLISMQIYPDSFNFNTFNPDLRFEKWACIEVADNPIVPEGMSSYTLPGGLYAVFLHRGKASDGEKTFRYIFQDWLPASGYVVDSQPHFEVLGEKYKHEDPSSEEEIWIPIKLK